jgi:GTP-binding protein EngB required for normal cell division
LKSFILLGPLNSGKSTIVNALLDRDPLSFSVHTKKIEVFKREGITLIDTPGFDGMYWNEKEMYEKAININGVILVHSAERGGFERNELEYLSYILHLIPKKYLWIAVSKIDCLKKQDRKKIFQIIAEEIKTKGIYHNGIFLLSARRYLQFLDKIKSPRRFTSWFKRKFPYLDPFYRNSGVQRFRKILIKV